MKRAEANQTANILTVSRKVFVTLLIKLPIVMVIVQIIEPYITRCINSLVPSFLNPEVSAEEMEYSKDKTSMESSETKEDFKLSFNELIKKSTRLSKLISKSPSIIP